MDVGEQQAVAVEPLDGLRCQVRRSISSSANSRGLSHGVGLLAPKPMIWSSPKSSSRPSQLRTRAAPLSASSIASSSSLPGMLTQTISVPASFSSASVIQRSTVPASSPFITDSR